MPMKTFLAAVIVFIVWLAIDFLIHGMLLQSAYQEADYCWRHYHDMHALLMSAVTLTQIGGISF